MSKKVLIIDDEADIRTFLEDAPAGKRLRNRDRERTATKRLKPPARFAPTRSRSTSSCRKKTGVKFYRELLKDAELQDVPVIILSGVTRYKELFARDHKTMHKPFAFVEKPIHPEELLAKVTEAVGAGSHSH